jgi:hypothetical protein
MIASGAVPALLPAHIGVSKTQRTRNTYVLKRYRVERFPRSLPVPKA